MGVILDYVIKGATGRAAWANALIDRVNQLTSYNDVGTGAPAGTGTAGQRYYDTAAKREYLSDGGGWIIMDEPIQTFATVVTAGSGTITTVGAHTMGYRRSGGWISWMVNISITTNGSGAAYVAFTFPVALQSAYGNIGVGREVNLTGSLLQVTDGSILTYNNAYPGGTGAQMLCDGHYQMASRYT